MPNYLIVANWKENPVTQREAIKIFDSVKRGVKSLKNVEVVICPPFVYLPLLKGLTLGAQNVFYKEKGAFTAGVSPLMLRDLKIKYVIVGHSESRKYFNETNKVINKKIKELLWLKIKPILCVGETIEEKKSDRKLEVLEKQIKETLECVSENQVKGVILTYEPVWAIGTGNNCSLKETKDSVLAIRKIISKLYNGEVAKNMKILYGGSVDSQNSASYIKEAGVKGLLVGGASLNAEEFIKIVKSVG